MRLIGIIFATTARFLRGILAHCRHPQGNQHTKVVIKRRILGYRNGPLLNRGQWTSSKVPLSQRQRCGRSIH
ncbi:hypothetical protein PIN31115_04437 [Pandoraea iniqua]|uniref:Uncharacterized protein n=1 Tax=Pandoraea iniqua TaxID=2508288 RepID=A0A5E4YEH4_9BURK|nr:hypothetical protein PIN31115_04437 [Pandoraea iniqua]